jgi:hypothetical protein
MNLVKCLVTSLFSLNLVLSLNAAPQSIHEESNELVDYEDYKQDERLDYTLFYYWIVNFLN